MSVIVGIVVSLSEVNIVIYGEYTCRKSSADPADDVRERMGCGSDFGFGPARE